MTTGNPNIDPANRIKQFDTTAQITGSLAQEMSDGALAYVSSTGINYQLLKASTATPAGTAIIAARGGGNWVATSATGSGQFLSTLVTLSTTAGMTVTGPTSDTWTALTNPGTATFSLTGNSNIWSVASTGVITYAGVTKTFLVQMNMAIASASGTTILSSMVDWSGAALVTTTTASAFEGRATVPVATDLLDLASARSVTMVAGDTLQAIVKNIGGTQTLSISRIQIAILPMI